MRYEYKVWGKDYDEIHVLALRTGRDFFGVVEFTMEIDATAHQLADGLVFIVEADVVASERRTLG